MVVKKGYHRAYGAGDRLTEVELTADDLRRIEDAVSQIEVQGERYPESAQRMITGNRPTGAGVLNAVRSHGMGDRRSHSRKEKHMEIKRAGSQPSGKGSADYFTGIVRIDPLFEAPDPARAVVAVVTFEPGARTAWHTHPLGQTLIVTAGYGRAQREGGEVEDIRPGDVIWFPPGEKHWHGAAPTTAMTHIAVQEKLDGKAVTWMEKVTDEHYGG